ncbi:hypothetical protein HUS70_03320 [Pandoraea nosoerga]|uniref:Uncharacterized protein n=1 Tax=Pandoraea nosoerga TaxID=2508296 RepID=A0A5E4TA83_9BURK|nr:MULTISPECIES: hypothetical protein [Pandoraea]MBN4664200.1 hypothetical protein [Pandoraea nosoerga]MBN4675391.1 hypothetical protein [Pandoraea nosoerga]MBN4679287.1 hypothetical protein [Pandoraea nosoerga]MBN4743715.1 hypothetical protein [Pandoraea nosoerga]VVD84371.1 hypothetical protein PNO31109_01272 [Pandoraea nosoerga]
MSYYHSKEEGRGRAMTFTAAHRWRRRAFAVTCAVIAALAYYAVHHPK